jgi:dynein heavy chain
MLLGQSSALFGGANHATVPPAAKTSVGTAGEAVKDESFTAGMGLYNDMPLSHEARQLIAVGRKQRGHGSATGEDGDGADTGSAPLASTAMSKAEFHIRQKDVPTFMESLNLSAHQLESLARDGNFLYCMPVHRVISAAAAANLTAATIQAKTGVIPAFATAKRGPNAPPPLAMLPLANFYSKEAQDRYRRESQALSLNSSSLGARSAVGMSPWVGNSGAIYDLMAVEHHDIDPTNYFTVSARGVTHFQITKVSSVSSTSIGAANAPAVPIKVRPAKPRFNSSGKSAPAATMLAALSIGGAAAATKETEDEMKEQQELSAATAMASGSSFASLKEFKNGTGGGGALVDESEFTSLAQWEREYRLFHASRHIKVFAQYRQWKAFTVWKKTINSGKRGSASEVLEESLFILNPTLRQALVRVHRLCSEVATWQLFTLDRNRCFSLQEFISSQVTKRVSVAAWLTEFSSDVRAIVRGACDDVLDAFLQARGISTDSKMTFMERSALRTECRRLSKFIVLADFMVRDTLLQLALDSTQALVTFITPFHHVPSNLVPAPNPVVKTDLHAVLSERERTARALELRMQEEASGRHLLGGTSSAGGAALAASARQQGGKTARGGKGADTHDHHLLRPVLTIAVSFEDGQKEEDSGGTLSSFLNRRRDQRRSQMLPEAENESAADQDKSGFNPVLVLSPSLHSVKQAVRALLYDAMVVISAPPRLFSHEELLPYTQAVKEENAAGEGGEEEEDAEMDLTEVATSQQLFRKLSNQMWSALEAAFTHVENYCMVFLPYIKTFLGNQHDIANIAERYTGEHGLEVFQEAITRYRSQIKNFDALPAETDVGTFRVDSVSLKEQIIPAPAVCLNSIREQLPVIISQLTLDLLTSARSQYSVLASTPTEVETFVAKVEMLEKVTEGLPYLRDKESHIRSLAQLMGENGWPIMDDLKAQFRLLKDTLLDLEGAAGKAESVLDEDTKRFARLVEQSIPPLRKAAQAIREKLDDPMIASADASVAKVVKFLRDQQARMDECKSLAAKFTHYQQQLRQPVASYEQIDEISQDMTVKMKLWEAIQDWSLITQAWRDAPFNSIDADEVGRQVQTYIKTAARSERMLPGNAAATKLRMAVEDFKKLLPVVQDMRSRALRARHWDEIETIIGTRIDPAKTYSLGELLEMRVVEHQPAISAVATKAVQELALEELYAKKVTSVWNTCEFIVTPYKDSRDVFILGGVDDVIALLDESLVTINTILGSRYCSHIRTDVELYQKRLMLLSETIDEWLTCQKQWMYLETIFGAEDIKRQLPEEAKKFAAVDKSWRAIQKRTHNNPNALSSGTVKGLKETLVRHNEVLDQINKSLEDYLETKRAAFPRFYFLSNDELLEILAQTRDPQAVQPHLRKCFDALVKLEFGKEAGSTDIFAMHSPENERVDFVKPLKARGNVEDWLTDVDKSMRVSLNKLMREGVFDYVRRHRKEWVKVHAGQVIASVAQIQWCAATEAALRDPNDPVSAVSKWYDVNVAQLSDLTALVRSNLTKLERCVIVALVTTDVHARDIIETLRDEKVTSVGNFSWQQQLRYYWDDEKQDCVVRQSNSRIEYGYEYMGATSRLVITPLTDRCWMTITGALNLKLGAAPAGPAGTGKTESSKDLAKALAIQCIVFNCSDQIDYLMLGKLFSGLAQAGSWTCLDEFNRIDIEVLSVVAQQLQQLRQGMLQGLSDMQFEGRHIRLKPYCVLVTMNPGYAGRTELPDNLKVQFRPVSMMVPDYALIAEIILFAEGFDDAKNLSRKMTRLYRLSSEQLSQQRHYDFGMRAVKSVLVMAGSLKRANPNLSEEVVLIRAMRDSNVPKFLADDLPLFHAIVGDLFPGVVVPDNELGELQVAIDAQIAKSGLQNVELYINKIMQVYETFNVRFGVVLVGPTGAGKTTCYKTLASAMTTLREAGSKNETFQKVHMSILNPKCITMGELYGEYNELTQEWRDGLASTIMRSYVTDETEDRKWTVFDGPIDALWIENMNTVLDDNQMLCLANGERIKLKSSMRMVFEVGDLEAASPATVSRLGVVFMMPEDLGWAPVVRTWLNQQLPAGFPEPLKEHVLSLFENSLDDGLAFRKANCEEPISTSDLQTAISLCRLFGALVRTAGEKKAETGLAPGLDFSRSIGELTKAINSMFAFAYVWSVGGSISNDGYERFDAFVRGHKSEIGTQVKWPPGGTVYDGFPDIALPDAPWKKWADVVPSFTYDNNQPYFAMVVPTIDTVRFSFLLSTHITQLTPVFLTGSTGTGKTVVVSDYLNRTSSPDYDGGYATAPIAINFSARTSSLDTQITIEGKLEKKKKTLLGAPTGKRVVIFVDDCNMPAVETYGAQPPIELLRQLVDMKGIYDRQKLFFKEVADTVLVAAAAPPGGGRAAITTRFTRHFHMLCMPIASDDVFRHIFGSIYCGFTAANGFSEDCKAAASKAVAATIEVFNRIRESMRPTPAKSHYTFNLRDVSKVFQGLLMASAKEVPSDSMLARLWTHECLRVFHDRLVNMEDKEWFYELSVEMLGRFFGKTGPGWAHDDLFGEGSMEKPLIWADFLRPSLEDNQLPPYEQAASLSRLVHVLDDGLDEYNISNPTQMKLVFFKDAVEHVARITRILRQPRGNAMLVGAGGSGKQSLTRMACHLSGVDCRSIQITRGYGSTEFREDLKKLMLAAGCKGTPIAFLFGDTQIVQEGFLEDVSNILNAGEVPGLFANDELSKITEEVRPVAIAKNIPDTKDNIYRLFVNRVRDNLHIILLMSPVGNALRVRCRQFPSLINCCTIDWYTPWPKDALLSVANRFLGEEESLGEHKAAVAEMAMEIHTSVQKYSDKFFAELQRKVYTTPKSYLDLLNLYLSMLVEKRAQLGELRQTLAVGCAKLEETNVVVESLQGELTKLQPVLEQKSKDAAAMLIQVSKEQQEADKIKVVVEKDAAEVSVQAAEVQAVQADAQKDLDVAMPALKGAEDALKKLDKKDITEVRSFAKPPPAVRTVMEAVCLLLGEKTDWDSAKAVLSRSSFMEDLITYDRDNIAPARLKGLVKYVTDESMSVEAVSRVSKAATTLAQWVHAVDIYSRVAKEVEPKKQRLAEMNAKLASANAVLNEKQSALQAVLDKVAELTRQSNEVTAEKENLAIEAQLTKDRLDRAAKLTVGLSDEQVRWKASVIKYDQQITALLGDALISAACISYYGAFTGSYRQEMVDSWLSACQGRSIPVSADFTLTGVLGDPVQIRDWQIAGLPTDAVSTDNAILVTRGKRWPLLIDPQEQAKKWIKAQEAKAKLAVTRFTNPNWLRTLETCIRIGTPLLIEDCGEFLDPALEPVLQRAVYKQGGRMLIQLGDSEVDYDPSFRLYLTTKMPNPHYLPEVCIKVTLINFTVTMSGLADQLLGAVVRKEKPEMEKRKNDLVVSMAKDKRQLKELEDKILKLLRESQGNILDDKVLIETLGESKELSTVIAGRLAESERTELEINEARDKYRPVATRGSLLYFVIADLALIDPMYQFSLAYFAQLYNRCIDLAPKSDDLPTRLHSLIDYLTLATYTNVCRGLFEAHKLLFSFLVCVQMMREARTIADPEWSLLLRGAGLIKNSAPNPLPDILSEAGWNLLTALEALPGQHGAHSELHGIVAHVTAQENAAAWRRWATQEEPQTQPLPAPWNKKVNGIQKLLMLKVWREEKLLFAVKEFVVNNLGEPYVQSPPVSLGDVFRDTREDTPVIFILSVGADPTGLLFNYAKQVGYTSRLRLISLGQGQGPRAQQLIDAACVSGDWVLLQNCHLARSWMPKLESIVDNIGARRAAAQAGSYHSHSHGAPVNPDFRLFLTSMPADYFPVPVLQNGVKLTNEPPKGIRANLTRSLANLENWTSFAECPGAFNDGLTKIRAWQKLVFGLCFFHAVVQERRKFGPLGFNIRYEINDSDLETSVTVLKMLLSEQPDLPFDALRYVTGQINYGGRVTDDWDRRCLMAILGKFYSPQILQEGYKFSPSGKYFAPVVDESTTLDNFYTYVTSLPLNDPPECFGMNNNANISNQRQETELMIKIALSLQPRSSGGAGGHSPDQIVGELAADMESELPDQLSMSEAGPASFQMKGEHMDSLATVLSQEMARFNKLLKVMSSTLGDLQRAIRGEVLMSDELDKMYTSFLNNVVPPNWEAVGYASLKPLSSWIHDLHARIHFMRDWLRNGQPKAFWLSGFFFPQGFLTGALQNHARKYHVAIDTLSFSFKMLKAEGLNDIGAEDVKEDGVLVYGLFMDGARWNRQTQMIDDSKPGELFNAWPVIHFMPTKDYKTPPGMYSAPVYKTSTRAGVLSTTGISTNYVVAVDVPTLRDHTYWILSGAALLSQLND